MSEAELIEIEQRARVLEERLARVLEERLGSPVYAMLRHDAGIVLRDLRKLVECARALLRIE